MTFKGGMFIVWFLMTLLFCVALIEPELYSDPAEFFGIFGAWAIIGILAIFAPIENQPSKRK